MPQVALSIRNTSLNGTLPGAWLSGQLGSSTGGPLPLQFLDLGDNPGLTGSLPEAWGRSQASLVSISMPGLLLYRPPAGHLGAWPYCLAARGCCLPPKALWSKLGLAVLLVCAWLD